MTVSIIIPVLNEYQALKTIIPSLILSVNEHAVELIVCDGGSSDLSHAYIKQCQLQQNPFITFHWVSSEKGRAKQMNAGAKQAGFEQLLFLHADSQLPSNWLGAINNKRWGRFNVCLSGRHYLFRIIEKMMNWRSCLTQVATGDQAMFVHKMLFNQVGGYPDIPLMEDIAISKLLRQQAPMSCIKMPVITSSRRWEKQGIIKTIVLMWQLRLAYFFGTKPSELAKRYYPNYQIKRQEIVVQVFTKLPILGFVKTRLIPQLGAEKATAIHRYLLKHSLDIVEQSQIKKELWVAQEADHQLQQGDEFLSYQTLSQTGDNLGDKMAYAIRQALESYKKVILMGTDCLDMTVNHLVLSREALDEVDIVLTPAVDGGFISIACRVFDEQIFEQVAWGSSTALSDVINNINQLSLSYRLLETVRDIDTYEDVAEYPELLNLNH